MKKTELLEGYEEFLKRYSWKLFGTLTFASHPHMSRAEHIFRRWIAEVQHGCPSLNLRWPPERSRSEDQALRWVRVAERGRFGDNLHFHVLLGGLRFPTVYVPLMLWNAIAGEAMLAYYKSNLHGLKYMLKTVKPGKVFDIDFQLPPAKSI